MRFDIAISLSVADPNPGVQARSNETPESASGSMRNTKIKCAQNCVCDTNMSASLTGWDSSAQGRLMDEAEIYRGLGRAVALRRAEIGATQAEIAAKIGLTRASLANIETGRQKVLLHYLYRLAAALDLQGIDTLLPSTSTGAPQPGLPVDESKVTPRQKAQLEQIVRLAMASGRNPRGRANG